MKIQLLIIIAFIIVNNSFSTNGKSKQANLDEPYNLNIMNFNENENEDDDSDNLGFLQKGTAIKKEENHIQTDNISEYSGPGYIDSSFMKIGTKISNSDDFKFKENNSPEDQFENIRFTKNDPFNPAASRELIRKNGLSNGVILNDRRRTCNFETGKYLQYYDALKR